VGAHDDGHRSCHEDGLRTRGVASARAALGLGLVGAVFTIFNHLVFRVDAVRNPGELFAVERPRSDEGS
jgi:hypothetical protein